jgi:hypothetical protein
MAGLGMGTTQDVAAADAGVADATLVCDALTPAASDFDAGLVARLSDDANNWLVATTSTTANVRIFQEEAGAFTLRATGAFAWANATTYRIRVVCSGTTISAYVNGALVASYASATFNQLATRFGLRENTPSNQVGFDNFRVTRP